MDATPAAIAIGPSTLGNGYCRRGRAWLEAGTPAAGHLPGPAVESWLGGTPTQAAAWWSRGYSPQREAGGRAHGEAPITPAITDAATNDRLERGPIDARERDDFGAFASAILYKEEPVKGFCLPTVGIQ